MKFNFLHQIDFISAFIAISSLFIFIYLFRTYGKIYRGIFILRTSILFLMILYLFNPVLKYYTNRYSSLEWALFFDNSSSIKFHKSPSLSSINLGVNNFLKKFNDKDISFSTYSFHSIVEPLNGQLNGKGQTTNIGNISEFLEQNKNKLAGSIIISDGIPTEGADPSLLFQDLDLKIYTLGVGSRSTLVDIFINSIDAPTVAIKNDRINLSAEVQSIGVSGEKFSVSLYDESRLIASKYVSLSGLNSKVKVNFQFQPRSLGRQKYKIQVSSISDEVNILNNRQSFDILILKDKYKVALFTGSPNKNTIVIKNTLNANSRIELDHYLKTFSNKFSIPIKNFWESAYDLILFENYPIEPLPPNFVRILAKKIISQQTGVMIVGGPNQNNKSLESLAPLIGFQLHDESSSQKDVNYWDFSNNLFESEDLPPLHRKFSISSTEKDSKDIAIFESGWTLLTRNIKKRLRSVIFTSSDLNKIFFYSKDTNVYSKIFSESINWLLRSGISTENYFRMNRDYLQQGEMAYLSGTKVGLADSLGYYVDVFRSDKIVLSADFDINTEKNIWETNFRTSIPGNYVYKVYSKQNEEMIQSTDFKVLDSQIEISQVYLNDKLLKEISLSSNGSYFDWNDRDNIFNEISQKGKQEIKANVIIFKDSVILISLIIFFLCTELILRKKSGLF